MNMLIDFYHALPEAIKDTDNIWSEKVQMSDCEMYVKWSYVIIQSLIIQFF